MLIGEGMIVETLEKENDWVLKLFDHERECKLEEFKEILADRFAEVTNDIERACIYAVLSCRKFDIIVREDIVSGKSFAYLKHPEVINIQTLVDSVEYMKYRIDYGFPIEIRAYDSKVSRPKTVTGNFVVYI